MNANVSGAAAAAAAATTGANSRPGVTLHGCAVQKKKKKQKPARTVSIIFFFRPQVVIRFSLPPFYPPKTSAAVLTVTAECLTALHAVCRISAADPGFSRFLVNLRLDSAAISSSERSPRTRQPVSCCCQSGLGPGTTLLIWSHALTRTHALVLRCHARARRRGLSKWAETSGCDYQIKARFPDRRAMTAEGAFDLL